MPVRALDRLLFAQGGKCFFCAADLPLSDASVEHLVAKANGGSNSDENCVACCKALNRLLGSMSLKEKLRVVLNQDGRFSCPNGRSLAKPARKSKEIPASLDERAALATADLKRRGAARPRSVKTLTSSLATFFQRRLSDEEIAGIVKRLKQQGVVTEDGTRVNYDFSRQDA